MIVRARRASDFFSVEAAVGRSSMTRTRRAGGFFSVEGVVGRPTEREEVDDVLPIDVLSSKNERGRAYLIHLNLQFVVQRESLFVLGVAFILNLYRSRTHYFHGKFYLWTPNGKPFGQVV